MGARNRDPVRELLGRTTPFSEAVSRAVGFEFCCALTFEHADPEVEIAVRRQCLQNGAALKALIEQRLN